MRKGNKFFMVTANKTKSKAGILIFLAWLVYLTSYLGKVNYSANITQIIDFYNVSKAEAGIVPTFFFFAYGIGQVVNGVLCKKYNVKWIIFISLFVSAAINLIVATTSVFAIVKWLWLINGFVLSILWPTLIRLLSEVLPQKDLGRSSVIMGTTVAGGTIIVYSSSSVFAAFGSFRLSFYLAAIAAFTIAVVWLIIYKNAVNLSISEKGDESKENKDIYIEESPKLAANEKKKFQISIGILCLLAVGVNLIKDGLTTWVPSILKDEYNFTDSLSILLTLLLPIVAIAGNAFALKMHLKIPDYIAHCLIVYAFIALIIFGIIGVLSLKLVIFLLVFLILASFLSSSLNSLITSVLPMFMRGKVNSGLFAGILNGFCYVGSTISSYGFGYIADLFGWGAVFWFLLAFCLLAVFVCLAYKVLCAKLLK